MIDDDKMFELQITIYLNSNRGDRLQVSETILLRKTDFMGMAKVLGRFHDLAGELKQKDASVPEGTGGAVR